ncbi:MAG: hypothetical protein PUE41_02185, partial [bacterium]|nr:hypothetical protein [bacterium]
ARFLSSHQSVRDGDVGRGQTIESPSTRSQRQEKARFVIGQIWGPFVEAAEPLGCTFNAHRYFPEAEPIRMPTSYRKTLRKTENQVFGAFVA